MQPEHHGKQGNEIDQTVGGKPKIKLEREIDPLFGRQDTQETFCCVYQKDLSAYSDHFKGLSRYEEKRSDSRIPPPKIFFFATRLLRCYERVHFCYNATIATNICYFCYTATIVTMLQTCDTFSEAAMIATRCYEHEIPFLKLLRCTK